jgi:glutamate--cysteine ligase
LTFRSHIWLNTDRARTGMLPFAFDGGFGFDRYAEHALDVPMYFVIRNKQYVNVAGESFRAFMRGELPQLPGERPTIKDWEDHLSTLFPEVRLKQFLEMRGADMGDRAHVLALPALWVGLLYDDAALADCWDHVKKWSIEEMLELRNAVPKSALKTQFRNCSLSDIASAVVANAREGLKRRGLGEEIYLAPLEETLRLGKTPAERWLDKYNGEWNGDISRIFHEAEI